MRYPKLLATGLVLGVLFGMLGWLVGTTSGLRFLAARVLPQLPVALDPADIDGRLLGPLSIGRIEVALPGVQGTIERIELDWRPVALLSRSVHLRSLAVDGPRFQIEPAEFEPQSTEDRRQATPLQFTLPLAVVVEQFSLRDGALSYAGDSVLDKLQVDLAGRAAGEQLELHHLAARSTQGEITGRLRLSSAPAVPWDVDLAWHIALDDTPLAGHTRITGSLAELRLEQSWSSPAAARLSGTVRGLPDAADWALRLELDPLPERGGPWPEILDGLSGDVSLTGHLADSVLAGQLRVPGLLPGPVALELAAGWRDGTGWLERGHIGLADGGELRARGHITPADALAAEFSITATGLGWPLDAPVRDIEVARLSLQGSGAGDQWQVSLDGRGRREGLPELDIEAELEWAATTLTVERLALVAPDESVRIAAQGTLQTADDRLDYRVMAEADLRLPGQPPLSARLSGAGDAEGLEFESLTASLLDGTIEGQGRIAWAGVQAADFRLSFRDLDPSGAAPDWPGRLSGELELQGLPTLPDGLELTLDALRGELRGLPVSGAAVANVSNDTLLLRPSELQVGTASLAGSGRLSSDAIALDARLEAPELESLHAWAGGSILAVASVAGPRELPGVTLEASGERLRWQQTRVRRLQVEAALDPAGERHSHVRLELDGFATAPGPGARVRLEGEGLPAEHQLRLSLERLRPAQHLRLQLDGGLQDTVWSGWLSELRVEEEEQPIWALSRPAAIKAGADRVGLDGACMDGTLGLLCLDASWDRGGPWRGSAKLSELDLEPLTEWLGMGLAARGVVTGEATVAADDVGFQGLTGAIELTAGDIRLAGEDSHPLVAWQRGTLSLDGDASLARVDLSLDLHGADRVEGGLAIAWNEDDPGLEGRIEADLAQLEIIAELLPELSDLEGRASLRGSVSGTLSAPVIAGRFEWLDGAAQIPVLGLRPSELSVVAELEGGLLRFDAGGRSGDGHFEAGGRFALDAATLQGQATLRGEDLLLADLPEARVAASPDLRLDYSERGIVIAGEVRVPFARITGLGGPTAISASPDEVLVGPRARPEEEELVVRSRVRVTVGPDVRVQAAGLRGAVEGELLTVTEPQALPWGRGELRVVDGTFSAFGQRLEIETGRLIYTGGPLENPGLEIRAVRRVDPVTAGALVRGTLQQPEISIYSDPPMPRAEALSYLTLGKSLDELQAGEQRTVNQAASSLALSGGGLIAQDLGRQLGFDDVAVTADDNGAALVVSKYLGGGLYVSYGLGLFDTVNTLRLRYQINPRLSLEATSGEEAAADLFYTFERD